MGRARDGEGSAPRVLLDTIYTFLRQTEPLVKKIVAQINKINVPRFDPDNINKLRDETLSDLRPGLGLIGNA